PTPDNLVCAHSLLDPRQIAGFPAIGHAAMALAIDVPLEAASDVETLGITCRGQRLSGRPGARAAAADEIKRRALVAAGQLLDPGDEFGVHLHLRIDLPAHEPG